MSDPHLGSVRPAFHAVVRAAVPAAAELDAEGWARGDALVERALDGRPEGVRRQLRLFLRILSVMAFLRFGRTLARLEPEDARRLLAALERSRLLLLRRGVWGLRTLAFMAYYARDEGRRAVGYDARLRGWEARGHDAGPWPGRDGAGAPEAGIVTADGPEGDAAAGRAPTEDGAADPRAPTEEAGG